MPFLIARIWIFLAFLFFIAYSSEYISDWEKRLLKKLEGLFLLYLTQMINKKRIGRWAAALFVFSFTDNKTFLLVIWFPVWKERKISPVVIYTASLWTLLYASVWVRPWFQFGKIFTKCQSAERPSCWLRHDPKRLGDRTTAQKRN